MAKLRAMDWIFRGRTFCCCLPVRMGVISMSVLGILFGGLLSIVLWFEVANSKTLTSGEKSAFVVAGLVQTFLLLASLIGFVGAIVRKQAFVQIYVYTIYTHFVLNIAIGIFLLVLVTKFSTRAAYKVCMDTITDSESQKQCTGFLNIARGVYIGITLVVWLIEAYGAIIAARYLDQLKSEKRDVKERFSAIKMARRSQMGSDGEALLSPQSSTAYHPPDYSREFNPYGDNTLQREASSASTGNVGYGGGSWTYNEISEREKTRLRQIDEEMGIEEAPREPEPLDSRRDSKSPAVPHFPPPERDNLPRYTLRD